MKKLFSILLLSSLLINARVHKEEPPILDEIHEEYVRIILQEQYFKVALFASGITTMAGIIVAATMGYVLSK